MNRKAMVALGALWIMLWTSHGMDRLERIQRDAPTLAMSAGERAAVETGDPELVRSIRSGRNPGLHATEFEKFRSAFELYPFGAPGTTASSPGRAGFIFLIHAAVPFLLGWRIIFRQIGWRKAGSPDRAGMILIPCAIAASGLEALMAHSAWSNWDAWAVWDFKTKAILHEGWLPKSFLMNPDYGFTHPEYPLLWPWLEASVSWLVGGIDTRWLRLLAVACAMSVPFILAALMMETGIKAGRWLIAGLISTMPIVLNHSSNGYVDWPLAAVESAGLLLAMRCRRGAAPGWTVGLAAGIAANLKQEGLIFGIGLMIAMTAPAPGIRARLRSAAIASLLFLVLALPWQFIRISLGIHPADFGLPVGQAISEFPGRCFLFVRGFLLEAFGAGPNGGSMGDWWNHLSSSWLVFWFVAGYAVLTGWRRLSDPVLRIPVIVVGVQVLGALGAYALTVRDVPWLLTTSLDRLMLQWVPAVTIVTVRLTREWRGAAGGADRPRR